jgi:hypothetical protein
MLVIHLSVSLVQTSSHRGPYRYFTRLASTKVHLTDVSMLCHTFVSSQIARTSTQAYIATYLRCLGMYVPRHVLTRHRISCGFSDSQASSPTLQYYPLLFLVHLKQTRSWLWTTDSAYYLPVDSQFTPARSADVQTWPGPDGTYQYVCMHVLTSQPWR